MSDKLYTPSNPNAQQGVRNVLKYLSDITYEKIITGQHTQTMAQEELHLIEKVTGKQPALLGFELLSYSPNINYSDTDDECMTEVMENYGTLKRAWEWAEKKGLITMCWHWFSPLYGRSKSFFSENTGYGYNGRNTPTLLRKGSADSVATLSRGRRRLVLVGQKRSGYR